MATRILTWNLQGRERPDLDDVAGAIASFGPDVVALQEVQRAQARALAARLGWTVAWRFKHWSVVVPPEGLALLTPAAPDELDTAVLARRWRFWSWRRRIAIRATVTGPDGPLAMVVTHLGAGVDDVERRRQAALTVEALERRSCDVVGACIVGDLNARPDSAVLAAYQTAGFRDAWSDRHPHVPVATSWRRGPRDGAPARRLDYVLVDDALAVDAADVPSADFARWGALSDHLPVVVTVSSRGP